ncbi:MAG: CBS domain-containing protein [Gemmataceae bacterium]|nr:CBS domain-containing protein [Gemmataceae bacterium]
MTTAADLNAGPTLRLYAETARDLMAPNPISIRADAHIREALALLTDKGFSAAPVIDDAGRPIGVLSRSDLLVHDREKSDYLAPSPEYFYEQELHTRDGRPIEGFQVENVETTRVRDLMTPALFAVSPDTPAAKVISDMIGLRVHRLFVVDDDGVLVGVISTMDVLKRLRP